MKTNPFKKSVAVATIALVSLLILFAVSVAPAMAQKPDLVISEINPNCGGYLFGNESNEISAMVENIGVAPAEASYARFVLNEYNGTVEVPALAAGANKTVTITDSTIRNAGDTVTITVTADCNAEVDESNENNNTATLRDTTVVNNGYKGKRYTGGEDITTLKTYDLNGNLLYSVGDSYYLSASTNKHWTAYDVSWTASDLPVAGTVKEARLYVPYTWDKKGVMPTYVSLSLNGVVQTLDAHYSDEKMHAASYPYGMLAYDVTADFDTSGNVANLTNSYPDGGNVSMRGMLLVVIYENANEPRSQIYVNEEFDVLYGGSSKCTTPEEATAYAPFGAIDLCGVGKATLITVAPGADGPEGDLIFNDQIWTNVWSFSTDAQIGIDERDVTAYLLPADNEAGFQSSDDWMEASNAFLIVEYFIPVDIDIKPGSCPNPLPLKSKGVLPVAILGTKDFDVTTVDPATILLTREGFEGYVAPIRCSYKDVATPFTGEQCGCHELEGDGILDLTLKFDTQELISTLTLSPRETIPLTLTGNLKEEDGGTPIKGEDCIWVLK